METKQMHSGWYVSIMELRSLTDPDLIGVAVLKLRKFHILILPFGKFLVLRVKLFYECLHYIYNRRRR